MHQNAPTAASNGKPTRWWYKQANQYAQRQQGIIFEVKGPEERTAQEKAWAEDSP